MRGPALRGACLWRELERVRRRARVADSPCHRKWPEKAFRAIATGGTKDRVQLRCAGKHSR